MYLKNVIQFEMALYTLLLSLNIEKMNTHAYYTMLNEILKNNLKV